MGTRIRTIINPLGALKPQAIDTEPSWMIPEGRNAHLGGYGLGPLGDRATYCPNLWAWAIKLLNIRSVIDIGCGEGCSSRFFLEMGCAVLGVEGYQPAIKNSRIPGHVALHDYTTGPFIPDRSFDMAWSSEFVEHIEERYLPNFFVTLQHVGRCFITFATPGQGGHHHVNEQEQAYWVSQFAKNGFELDEDLTACGRLVAMADRYLFSPDYPSHFTEKGLAFLRRSPL